MQLKTYFGERAFRVLLPVLIIISTAILLFGLGSFKVLWGLGTNIKVIAYIVGGIVVLKLLKKLGFNK